jgi:hypothetical protein
MPVQCGPEFLLCDLVIGRNKRLHSTHVVRCALASDPVDFRAVAGGQYDHFFQDSAGAQLIRGLAGLFNAKRDAFAQLNARGTVADSYEGYFHVDCWWPASSHFVRFTVFLQLNIVRFTIPHLEDVDHHRL